MLHHPHQAADATATTTTTTTATAGAAAKAGSRTVIHHGLDQRLERGELFVARAHQRLQRRHAATALCQHWHAHQAQKQCCCQHANTRTLLRHNLYSLPPLGD